ncbi:MGMT family protein [Ferrimonas lipolytica]|uniref:Methylated-DNA--[protein]-cysteine S-methyltransferase n=1 Tax=Ferrimonas lipolytica TaxID=2724191 RepID=A0A6H1UCV2_9GAMM|nr:methylated-DNA--[protein]-cysteine S-methyltransferase [Ferrimonas lipolytica]QIZ76183.1 methylated-DNA--[protein]-cysteine S-methyltransferase [Ferrimonas lipolytica]
MNIAIKKIWSTLQLVPTGKVVSYGQLADLAGLPRRHRLAARALKIAPTEMALPWHRVLATSGQISIAKESDNYRKQMELLRNEGVEVINGRVDMKRFRWQPDLAELLWTLQH